MELLTRTLLICTFKKPRLYLIYRKLEEKEPIEQNIEIKNFH